MVSIKQILMDRDKMSEVEALDLIIQAKEDFYTRLEKGEQPYDICEEWFGLEPDYIMELI